MDGKTDALEQIGDGALTAKINGGTDREKLLFSKKESVPKKLAEQVVAKAIEYELFDATIFESFKVLTSNGIQKRYFVATKERKQVEIVGEYLLAEIPPGQRVKITSLNGDACG